MSTESYNWSIAYQRANEILDSFGWRRPASVNPEGTWEDGMVSDAFDDPRAIIAALQKKYMEEDS